MFFWIRVEKFMLSVRLVLEICGIKVVVSFNFALSAPHVKGRVKSCEPSAAAATNILRVANNIQVLRTPEYIYVVFDMFYKAIAITLYKLS